MGFLWLYLDKSKYRQRKKQQQQQCSGLNEGADYWILECAFEVVCLASSTA